MYVLSADIFMKAIHYQMIIFVRFVNTEWQILSRYREKRIENKGGVEEIRLLFVNIAKEKNEIVLDRD